jgi:tetraacyldisaccharide 4'-kinase
MLSEHALNAVWYGQDRPALWLRALSGVYAALVRLRRSAYSAGLLPSAQLRVPVIVVGNITAGGAGKTPLVMALVEALRARGFQPGVISRGYAGAHETAIVVDEHSDASAVGDEAALVFQQTRAPFVVCRDRVRAGRVLLEASAVDVIICDDGLQHYRLRRDIEICVIDGVRRFGNGHMLPAGPLREPVSRLQDVALRVCNGGQAQPGEVPMHLSGDVLVAVADPSRQRQLRDFAGLRVHAVAGIGNPERFFAQLRSAGLDVIPHPFADHFPYAANDLDFGDDLAVVMTAKDAIKCTAFAGANCWSLPVRGQLPEAFFETVAQRARHVKDRCRG